MGSFLMILNEVVIAIVALIVFTFIFMWIWNLVMPDVFGTKKITPWQALGILILASILFGGHRVVYANPHWQPPPHAGISAPL
jgi:hypothetical protein